MAAAKSAEQRRDEILGALRRPFPAGDVKQRQGGGGKKLDYIPIETTIERFLTEAPGYSWAGRVVMVSQDPDGKNWVAVVEGNLEVDGKSGFGVGAMKNPDVDMAVKSANSEAFKNAAKNGFGTALELWNEEHRESLQMARAAAGGSEAALKKTVFDLAKKKLDKKKPTVTEVAELFGVEAGELSDKATLEKILRDQGVL